MNSNSGCIMDIKKFAVHDGPGIRTTVFLKGCPLHCVWCHNPEGISLKPQLAYYTHKCIQCGECVKVCQTGAHYIESGKHHFDRSKCTGCSVCEKNCLGEALKLFGKIMTVKEIAGIVLEDHIFYEQSGGGVTLSGGEPLLQRDFCLALLEEFHNSKIHTALDTCGSIPWQDLEKTLPWTGIYLYDVKHIDSSKHRALTGQGNETILDNLKKLCANSAEIEIRMPLIPGFNNDNETLKGIGTFLGNLPIRKMKVLPYNSLAHSKYAALGMKDTMPDVPSPADDEVKQAVQLLRTYGVNAVSGKE